MLDSVKIILEEAQTRFPGLPRFLYGHSMGGAVVVNYLLKRPANVKGALVTAPLFQLAFEPPAFKVFLGRIMNNIFPKFTEKANLDADAISRDKEEVRKYNADPYNHGRITTGLFFGMQEAGKWALAHASELKTPLLVMHGTADRLNSYEASKAFSEKASDHFITFKTWEGYYHELHNEPEPDRTEVLNYIVKWLEVH
jgi:alpha-beta hydrolase superfamily lysophospholipase